MAKVWSFNTTVRNPERMESLLRVLSEVEGTIFNEQGQEHFFGLLIRKRLYTPTVKKLCESKLINAVHKHNLNEELDSSIVTEILAKYNGGKVNAAGRGRTAAGILNRFGLCIALQSQGEIIITELGKKWLNGEIDDETLFTRFFLKWQYPNPIESGYEDFNIKPFPAVLKLIHNVNEEWKKIGHEPVGISLNEFRLFVPSLTKSSDIEKYVKRIIEYRINVKKLSGKDKTTYMSQFARQRIIEIYGDMNEKKIKVAINDLKDYSDSSIRYFRMSRLIAMRGENTHVDIAKDRLTEVDSILSHVDTSALEFSDSNEYIKYLNDTTTNLPWENENELKKISTNLLDIIKTESKGASEVELATLTSKPLTTQVDILQNQLNEIRIEKLRNLRHDVKVLDDAIQKISSITSRNYETLTARPSLDFEWYTSRALMVLNDAIRIVPSYKIGDDGIPTGFKGNTSDIECEYDTFGMSVEVTLLRGRDQWIAEGQPVMRHLRDFEVKSDKPNIFCIFIAPYIHRDTLNTFWSSNKFGYEGKQQRIIPLTIDQFIVFLTRAKDKIIAGELSNQTIGNLLQKLIEGIQQFQDSQLWQSSLFPKIQEW